MNPQNAMEWNKKAYKYEKQGNVSEALRCIEEAVKIQPRSEVYLLHKATVLEKAERVQEALEIYHHVMTVIPQSTKGYIGIVRCLNKLGRNEEIEAYDEEIMKRLRPETSPFIGEFKMGEKKLTEEQKRELRKTLGPFSDRELGGMMDYLSEYEQKQNENAEKAKILLGEDYVKKLLEENPNARQSYHFPEPYNSMSLEELKHLRNINQKEKTISDKETLVLKNAFRETIYNYLENQASAFTIKALEKRLDSFIEDLDERKYGKENLEQILNKLRAHGRINSVQHNGETHYFVPKQPPISTNPSSIRQMLQEALILFQRKEYNKCKEFLKHLLDLEPELAEGWVIMGQIELISQNYPESIEYLKKALEVNPTLEIAWSTMGNVLDQQGMYDKAIQYYDKALEINPNFAPAWNNKGLALDILQKHHEAIKCYERSLELNPNNAGNWFNKGETHVKVSEYQQALYCYHRALQIVPSFQKAQEMLDFLQKKKTSQEVLTARGFFSDERYPFKDFMNIYISVSSVFFEGIRGAVYGKIVDSRGYRYEIPWIIFDSVTKTSFGVIPGVTLKTKDGTTYKIVPVNDVGKWNRKTRMSFIDKINTAKPQIEEFQ